VRDEACLLEAMRGCDAVYHFAAFQDYLPTFSRFFDVNVTSTALIYELIVRESLPVRKVIVASSQAAAGEGLYLDADGRACFPDIRTDEQLADGRWELEAPLGFKAPLAWQRTSESVANPQNQYGLSKIAEENVALHLGRRYCIPSVAMRYSIVQGPRQSVHNAYSGACRVFCLSFDQGVEPSIYEDGQQIRDFVNIHDVVDANLLVLHDARADYEMFNVGGDVPMTVGEFAAVVAEAYGKTDFRPKPSGQYRFGDTRHICSDVSKLKEIGWQPRRTVRQSVDAYRRWLAGQTDLQGILARSMAEMADRGVLRACRRS